MATLKYILATTLLLFSVSVWAHTGLASSSPNNKQVLSSPPQQISLSFKGKVHLLKIGVSDSAGNKADIDFKPSATAAKQFDINLPDLKPEKYEVKWSIMSKDGHKISKTLSFTIEGS